MAYKDQRVRTWIFVVYPESALHDKDVNHDGEVKKAHLYIILFFDGKKSEEITKR